MKDRHARSENSRSQVLVTRQELEGHLPHHRGVPAESIGNVLIVDRTTGQRGVASPFPSYADDIVVAFTCSAITKKGLPCKAAPNHETGLCVGHARAYDAS